MARRILIEDEMYRGLKVNRGSEERPLPLIRQCLDNIIDQLNAMLSYHCHVLVLRFELFVPEGIDMPKKAVTDFVNRLKRVLVYGKTHQGKSIKRIGYVWAREESQTPYSDGTQRGDHIHFALYINGDQVKSFGSTDEPASGKECDKGMFNIIQDAWRQQVANGHVNIKGNNKKANFHQVKRNGEPEAFENCIYALSYLAKTNTKDHNNKSYGASQLKLKVSL